MEKIYEQTNLDARIKAERIIELVKTFENYAEKLELNDIKIKDIEAKFDKELKSIAYMIKQSKPLLDMTDINNLIEEYININSDTY